MKTLLFSLSLLLAFALNAQTANDTTYWKISLNGDTAIYHIKAGKDLKLKRSSLATFHKLTMNGHGTETNCKLHEEATDTVIDKMNIYFTIPAGHPYFNITNLTAGNYSIRYVACHTGGNIKIELE